MVAPLDTLRGEGLTDSRVIVRGNRHVETELAGQTLMMSIGQGKYFAVDAVAKRIWDLLAQPRSISDVVDALLDEFDVAPDTCTNEVLAFVAHLQRNDLIDVLPSPP